jgi:DNA-binding transcriptional ArsR family regulator
VRPASRIASVVSLAIVNNIVYYWQVAAPVRRVSRASLKRTADDRLDVLFKALGDRTRRAVLARLAEEPHMITELAEPFAMSLPAVSRHIRVLENAGLVVRAIDGRVHQCALDAAPLEKADAWLDFYRRFWAGQLESLARHVKAGTATRSHRSGEGETGHA